MNFNVSIGKIKTLKHFISISSNFVSLLILMPRFQILYFPGPEMAKLLKNTIEVLDFSKNKHLKNSTTGFFHKTFSVML